ncbi:hypothetical protein HOLleu_35695 [Holothuria leucospilota]|uniref:Alkylated DNA repair protein AlkB homologue 8 N-terminal domain-containing protein n=1 Tax=Holothuria leucospilota TaxID=206669 RepID=A0A9Q0YL59_HOLLE|nr:hypothetical protein HOLleu_35695 [Holothuria leucospilota]
MFFIRQLKKIHLGNTLLVLFYKSIIQSILTFNLNCCYFNLKKANKTKIDRPRKTAQKIIGLELPTIESLYNERICFEAKTS